MTKVFPPLPSDKSGKTNERYKLFYTVLTEEYATHCAFLYTHIIVHKLSDIFPAIMIIYICCYFWMPQDCSQLS